MNPTTRPPRVLRVIGAVMPVLIEVVLWVLPAAMFATGLLMWRDWHALARGGVDREARVERCRWETMFTQKRSGSSRGSGGYYSCDYLYGVEDPGPTYSGHFQSSREWKTGEPIAIRYRPDSPGVSATVTDLAHPAVVPGGLMALPLLYVGWRLLRRIRPTTTA